MKAIAKKTLNHLISRLKQVNTPKVIAQILNNNSEICLNVGAGNIKGRNGWLTIDMTKNCDIYWDLRRGIPFPNDSVSQVYSSHFLEHLTYKEGQTFLDECLRVLASGGLFSICVPNAKLYIEAYINGTKTEELKYLHHNPAVNRTTPIDFVNYIAYMNGHHKYMFDQENLLHLLEAKGFQEVKPRKFDPRVDLLERDTTSIYAVAQKK